MSMGAKFARANFMHRPLPTGVSFDFCTRDFFAYANFLHACKNLCTCSFGAREFCACAFLVQPLLQGLAARAQKVCVRKKIACAKGTLVIQPVKYRGG